MLDGVWGGRVCGTKLTSLLQLHELHPAPSQKSLPKPKHWQKQDQTQSSLFGGIAGDQCGCDGNSYQRNDKSQCYHHDHTQKYRHRTRLQNCHIKECSNILSVNMLATVSDFKFSIHKLNPYYHFSSNGEVAVVGLEADIGRILSGRLAGSVGHDTRERLGRLCGTFLPFTHII